MKHALALAESVIALTQANQNDTTRNNSHYRVALRTAGFHLPDVLTISEGF